MIALGSRNQRLSRFWLTDQGGSPPAPELKGKSAVILDGEDDFVNMLRHVLAVMGMTSAVVRHEDADAGDASTATTWSSSGPARATRATASTRRSRRSGRRRRAARGESSRSWPSASGTRCSATGSASSWASRTSSSRAPSRGSTSATREENVGFYNTFVARVDGPLPDGVPCAPTRSTGDVHLVEGPHFRGIQFHAESILTEHGYDLIHDLVLDLLGSPDA